MDTNDIKLYQENVLKIQLLGGKIKPIYDSNISPIIYCMKDWVKDSIHSMCLSNISKQLKFSFQTIVGNELQEQITNLGINNIDIVILNDKYDYTKYSLLETSNSIKYITANIECIYINDTIIVDYLQSTKREIIDSINFLSFKEGIFCNTLYGKNIFCAIKIAQLPSSKDKNIIFHI